MTCFMVVADNGVARMVDLSTQAPFLADIKQSIRRTGLQRIERGRGIAVRREGLPA